MNEREQREGERTLPGAGWEISIIPMEEDGKSARSTEDLEQAIVLRGLGVKD